MDAQTFPALQPWVVSAHGGVWLSHTSQRDNLLHPREQQLQAQCRGHLWHMKYFPSRLHSCRGCPMSCPRVLARPCGMCSTERKLKARRTMAQVAEAAPMPRHGAAHTWALLTACLQLGDTGALGSCQPCPALGADRRLHLSHPPTPQRPIGSFPKIPQLHLKKPNPPPSEGAAAAAHTSSKPWGWQGRSLDPRAPASLGDASPSSAHSQVRFSLPAGL